MLNGRSLYWLSQETGIRWATLSAMVKGKAQRIDLDALERICTALECKPGELFIQLRHAATPSERAS
jgi:DNA-binding Xre family transcriptional regulator